jgi:hypothetical protein
MYVVHKSIRLFSRPLSSHVSKHVGRIHVSFVQEDNILVLQKVAFHRLGSWLNGIMHEGSNPCGSIGSGDDILLSFRCSGFKGHSLCSQQ